MAWMDLRKWAGLPKEAQQASLIMQRNCVRCHTDQKIKEKRLNEEAWNAIIDTMRTIGSTIPKEDQEVLAKYLASNYGPQAVADEDTCKRKIGGFVSGQLLQKPTIDLNGYYLFVLHDDNTVSVIDPLTKVGMTSALAAMSLRGTGSDFIPSADNSYIYISMPHVNQVAVVDTLKMRVMGNLDVGKEPGRLAIQPDGNYIWVSNQGSGDVSVIDTRSNKVKTTIKVGAGPHRFGFDNNTGYITSQAGRLNLVNLSTLSKVKELKVGKKLAGLDYSPISQAVYIADEELGLVHVYKPDKKKFAQPIKVAPGVSTVHFTHDGQWGFVLNGKNNSATILDASGRMKGRTIKTGNGPDQVVFTSSYAYIRNAGSEEVTLVSLASLSRPENINMAAITMFQLPPNREGEKSLGMASAIAPVPTGHGAVMAANPAERTVYYYMEGMNAPMGTMGGMIRKAKGILAIDRSLQEVETGVFTVSVKLKDPGVYDLPFLIKNPRVYGCFQLEVKSKTGELQAAAAKRPILVEGLAADRPLRPNEATAIRFRITSTEDGQLLDNLADVRIMSFRMPGNWRLLRDGRFVGNGVYEAEFIFPERGNYYILVEVPSKRVKFGDIRHVVVSVGQGDASSSSPRN